MKDKWKKNRTDVFNDRVKQRKEKQEEHARLLKEASKPDPNYKKDDGAEQPSTPATPATPQISAPKTPAPKPAETANRPGKADRVRRGGGRHSDRRF